MKTESLVHNPFMLMLSPDTVLAAVERSEKLRRLNRRMCHPLDRVATPHADATNPGSDNRQVRPLHDD